MPLFPKIPTAIDGIANIVSASRRNISRSGNGSSQKRGIEEARKEARLLIEAVADIQSLISFAFPDIMLSDDSSLLSTKRLRCEVHTAVANCREGVILRADFCGYKRYVDASAGKRVACRCCH